MKDGSSAIRLTFIAVKTVIHFVFLLGTVLTFLRVGCTRSLAADDRPVPTARSGMGCEFILETTEAGQWPILRLLHVMACQILVCHGRFPGRPPLSEFDRIPLKCAIDGNDSKLRSIMLTPSSHGTELRLESGTFDFLQLIGITDDEVLYAKENGGTKLLGLLEAARGVR